jgi:cell division protein FtsQ
VSGLGRGLALPRRRGAKGRRGHAVAGALEPVRDLAARISPRGWLIIAATTLTLFGGYMWLRESPLASIKNVTITGLGSTSDAGAIRHALTEAAKDMTSLHVRESDLKSAVAPFSIVKDVKADGDWPHTLRIQVIEYKPVAVLDVDGRLLPVAADGTLLRGELASRALPKVPTAVAPGGAKLSAPIPLAAVKVLGAAPLAIRPLIARTRRGPDGLRVVLVNGPQLIFGDSSRPRAKWAAAVRVLADPTSKAASYIDVRVPDRAVAGRFPTDSSATPAAPAATAPPVVPATPASTAATTASTPAATPATTPATTTPTVAPATPVAPTGTT